MISPESMHSPGESPSGKSSEKTPPFCVVGIGASAGGLEALEKLFERMPEDTGLAFVIVQHLSPDFQSHMDELLARKTRIRINRVEDGVPVEPNCIYLIPPRKEMIISEGRLLLKDKDPERGLTMPIDSFLRSLAQDRDQHAIAVILSGTGSDGSRGVRHVHDAGGLVIVQDEESAQFDGMPLAAINTGVVDLILPPEAIPPALVEHTRETLTPETSSAEDIVPEPEPGIEKLVRLLRSEYGIDFNHYKPSTVLRRTERRSSLTHSADVAEYAQLAEDNPQELNALYRDLLIGVTTYFRDPESFEQLAIEVIAPLLAQIDRQEEIRIWVPGCATGEEAYSLAILFHEHLEAIRRPMNIKIFATDVHRESLQIASCGAYSQTQLGDMSEVRRQRYFTRKGKEFHVIPELRQMIVFAPHNVITDAPFTKLHLISCRNLMIYFQPVVQKKVLSLFHFGLKAGGYLFLGPSESLGDLRDEFDIIDKHWKIYRKRRDVRLPNNFRVPLSTSVNPIRHREPARWSPPATETSLIEHYDALLARCMPSAILIDEKYQLLHTFGGAEKYLQVKGGRSPANVLEMFGTELKTAATGGLQHARKENTPVRYTGVSVKFGDTTETLRLVIEPISPGPDKPGSFLITFETLEDKGEGSVRADSEYNISKMTREQIGSLEDELRFTKENLQATIEELETSNEELQATNEELVASNEELQSTNEELQSVNEELYTVNAEYQRKITELSEMTDDMHNLLSSTDVGVIYLDTELCIRRFTPRVAESFNLLPQDVGRRLETFAHTIEDANLLSDVRKVLESEECIEKEVRDKAGVPFFLRILPYRTQTRTAGVVLTLIEISKLRDAEKARGAAESALRQRELQFRGTFENAAVGIAHKDLQGHWLRVNDRLCEIVGYTREEMINKTFRDVTHPEDLEEELKQFQRLISGEISSFQMEKRILHKNGGELWVALTVSLQRDDDEQPLYCIAIIQDVSQRKQFEMELQAAIEARESFLAMLSHELRNPLSAVMNATRLLRRGQFGDSGFTQDDITCVIERQSQQMAKLLTDLLDVSRISNGKIELARQNVDLCQLVDSVMETVGPTLEAHEIALVLNLPKTPVAVDGDPARLQQIQVNLLANAAKYSPPGSQVHFTIAAEGDEAVIRVKDEGIGIPSHLLEKIFEPFVQSDETLHRSEGGLGVGLTLVASLVKMHGGTVTAHSAGRTKGSEFLVRLPRRSLAEHPTSPPAEESPPQAKPLKIVLVEDQPDNAHLLQAHLRMDGHEVSLAFDGKSGLDLVLNKKPDLAIMDIGIPELNGYEVAKQVRKHQNGKDIFLVALTGYGQPADVTRARSAGFDAHLVKPLDFNELRELLAKQQS